eukprot:1183832-Prorocentrum_minimum.AAC.3
MENAPVAGYSPCSKEVRRVHSRGGFTQEGGEEGSLKRAAAAGYSPCSKEVRRVDSRGYPPCSKEVRRVDSRGRPRLATHRARRR